VQSNEPSSRLARRREKSDEGWGGGGSGWGRRKNDKLFRVSLFVAPLIAKLPPLCLSCGPVFIGKMLHGSQNWSLNFLLFFVNLIFLNFFEFF